MINKYQMSVFERQIKEEMRYNSFVSDRSFDNIAYSIEHSTISSSIVNSSKFTDYIEYIKKPDAIIFFVRPHIVTMKSDGVRETPQWESIIKIDAIIKSLLQIYGIKHIQINTPSIQERIETVKYVIDIYEGNKK